MTYHNTTAAEGEQLREYRKKALTQEEVILKWFRDAKWYAPKDTWSPSQVQSMVLPNAPLTSVRRALTDLTATGVLVKTDTMVDGLYGRPEGTWRLADPVQGTLL